MINNGWNEQEYSFGEDKALNSRLSVLISEFCHVFRLHADGNWKSIYKPRYTELMANELKSNPSLFIKLKALKGPVVRNIVYAAVEFNKLSSRIRNS